MSSDAYNTSNYQPHAKYQQHMQHQQNHYQQPTPYINPNIKTHENQAPQQYHVQHGQQFNQQTTSMIQPVFNQQQTSTNVYLALLGVADTLLKSKQYLMGIHCLESILTLKNHDISIVNNLHVQLKTRLYLCRLYLRHTIDTNQYVNAHLEKSVRVYFLEIFFK